MILVRKAISIRVALPLCSLLRLISHKENLATVLKLFTVFCSLSLSLCLCLYLSFGRCFLLPERDPDEWGYRVCHPLHLVPFARPNYFLNSACLSVCLSLDWHVCLSLCLWSLSLRGGINIRHSSLALFTSISLRVDQTLR